MLSKLSRHLSYPNVVATLALFIALGGGAYAATKAQKNSVNSKAIRNGQVKSVDVANQGLTGVDVKDGSLGSAELGGGVVTGPKIAAGVIESSHLLDNAITSAKIGSGAVGGSQLLDGAVTGAKIADGSVAASDLDPGTVGDVISTAGTFPNDGVSRQVLALAGLGKMTMSCTGAETVNAFYSLEKGFQQNARVWAHDPLDNEPKGAIALAGSAGGGVGYSGPGHPNGAEGNFFVFTDDRVLSVDFFLNPGSSCVYRVRATLDHNET